MADSKNARGDRDDKNNKEKRKEDNDEYEPEDFGEHVDGKGSKKARGDRDDNKNKKKRTDYRPPMVLQTDHSSRPPWVAPSGHNFLERFSPVHQQAGDFCEAMTAPVCLLGHIQECKQQQAVGVGSQPQGQVQELMKSSGRAMNPPQGGLSRQVLMQLLQTLRDPNNPNQQQQILEILRNNPPLLEAFIRQRENQSCQMQQNPDTASSQLRRNNPPLMEAFIRQRQNQLCQMQQNRDAASPQQQAVGVGSQRQGQVEELVKSSGGAMNPPQGSYNRQALRQLLQTLKGPNNPNQQQQVLEILRNNPPLLEAFIRQRDNQSCQMQQNPDAASPQQPLGAAVQQGRAGMNNPQLQHDEQTGPDPNNPQQQHWYGYKLILIEEKNRWVLLHKCVLTVFVESNENSSYLNYLNSSFHYLFLF